MDPLTQGVVGAVLPQSVQNKRNIFWAGVFGLVGGMAPDLDALIRSDQDPLLYLEYHRQFSHSLIFIPVGGLLCALLCHLLIGRQKKIPFKLTYLSCMLGYGTHGLLDAMTSYGTQLFWPFLDWRISWSLISIIDPLFTLPILILAGVSIWKGKAVFARVALVWAVFYLSIGVIQHQRAYQAGLEIVGERGHMTEEVGIKPSFGNLLVWKVIYRHENTFYVDAVRAGLEMTVFEGNSIDVLDIRRDFPWLQVNSQQAQDIERFRWFSNGYLAQDPNDENRIIDVRYSLVPNRINAMWSIELSQSATTEDHVKFAHHRKVGPQEREALFNMVFNSP